MTAERTAPDHAYRTLLGHTTTCPNCRAGGAPCATATQLMRAWRRNR
ncbi:hypothetical protein [Streptomyces sp. NPDC017448]